MDTAIERETARAPDRETGIGPEDGRALRVWIRLLTCANIMEGRVRRGLAQELETTLPQFDVLAQLYRAGGGLTMSELSRRLMVTNGNSTGLVDRLSVQGDVERTPVPGDRRASLVRLTRQGRKRFETMIPVNRGWIETMVGGLSAREQDQLLTLLAKLKQSVLTSEEQKS